MVMGKEATAALRKLYDLYGKSLLDWLASLYDPETGFFYYAGSARDNDGFLPDCESTCRTLGGIFGALGIPRIPMCNNNDFLKFRAKIELAHDKLEGK